MLNKSSDNTENKKSSSSDIKPIKLSIKNTGNKFRRLIKDIDIEYNLLVKENAKLKSEIALLNSKLNVLTPPIDLKNNDADYSLPSFSKKVGAFLDGASTKFKISRQKSLKMNTPLTHQLMFGHTDSVVNINCSNQFSIICSSSLDGTCKIWSTELCSNLFTYKGHKGAVNSSMFCPTDQTIVSSASGDGSVHIWSYKSALESFTKLNAEMLKQRSSIIIDENAHRDISKNPIQDHNILLKPLSELKSHYEPVSSVDWIYDGKSLVSGSWDANLIVWDAETSNVISRLTGHEDQILYVQCHPSQKTVLSTSVDSTFRIWDIRNSGKPSVTVNRGHTGDVTCALFVGNSIILTASLDKYAKIWDLKNMREPVVTCKASAGINRSAITSNNLSCLPLKNNHFKIWDFSKKSSQIIFTQREGHSKSIEAACWHEINSNQVKSLFTSSIDSTIIKWNVEGFFNLNNQKPSFK